MADVKEKKEKKEKKVGLGAAAAPLHSPHNKHLP
jgi:hypothetical protein